MKLRTLKQKLRKLGYFRLKKRGKGNHSIWRSSFQQKTLVLSGKDNTEIKPYQKLMLKNINLN